MTKQKAIVAALVVLLAGVTIWRIFFATEEATVDETPLAVTVQQVAAEEVQLPVTSWSAPIKVIFITNSPMIVLCQH